MSKKEVGGSSNGIGKGNSKEESRIAAQGRISSTADEE
jgi:hypothetical protein